MNQQASPKEIPALLETLPGDDVRQIMWRFSARFDYQMVVQSARAVARGPVARAVAKGARNSHEWTEDKAALLLDFDAAGITAAAVDPEYGGYIEGPKNFLMGLIAYELAWVDAGEDAPLQQALERLRERVRGLRDTVGPKPKVGHA